MPSSANRRKTYDLPVTSLDALRLSYRRLVEASPLKNFDLPACISCNKLNNVEP